MTKKLKRLVANDGNKFFELALSSAQMKELTGGTEAEMEVESCGCHSCANLCCSGLGSSVPILC